MRGGVAAIGRIQDARYSHPGGLFGAGQAAGDRPEPFAGVQRPAGIWNSGQRSCRSQRSRCWSWVRALTRSSWWSESSRMSSARRSSCAPPGAPRARRAAPPSCSACETGSSSKPTTTSTGPRPSKRWGCRGSWDTVRPGRSDLGPPEGCRPPETAIAVGSRPPVEGAGDGLLRRKLFEPKGDHCSSGADRSAGRCSTFAVRLSRPAGQWAHTSCRYRLSL
jgi:hypothetical protein